MAYGNGEQITREIGSVIGISCEPNYTWNDTMERRASVCVYDKSLQMP